MQHHHQIFIIRSTVQLITSTRAGMGKSLYIKKMAHSASTPVIMNIPLHGPIVTSDRLIKQLTEKETDYSNAIVHLDIASAVSYFKHIIILIMQY